MTKKHQVGVILMTYGSPKTLDDIPAYLKNVYGGKDASAEVITEFRRRYNMIGGSPLVKITQNQAAALERGLNKQTTDTKFQVAVGMRFSDPFIEGVIKKLALGSDMIVGIIMSPQYSPIIMSGYRKELERAVTKLDRASLGLKIATDWHLEPNFIRALAQKVQQQLNSLPENVPILFSAHSMPKRVIDTEPNYINQLKETAAATAKAVGLSKDRWTFCYQSAGHTPEEWLKPDFADIMPKLQKKGHTHVLIAPIQFLADHLEILYDIDIAAREQAEKHGLQFSRTTSLNDSPLFIKALATIVKETVNKD